MRIGHEANALEAETYEGYVRLLTETAIGYPSEYRIQGRREDN